jgi:glycosyltransferase involved in cell wall biosynthesis
MSGATPRLFAALVRTGLWVYLRVLQLVQALPRRRPAARANVLLTGTFVSDNWLRAHLQPLAAAEACGRIWMVASRRVPDIPNVRAVYPWRWVARIAGPVPARLLTFAAVAIRTRPDIVGGFHLLFNGMAAALLAPLVGARSMYICVGGPAEVLDGGIRAENRLFSRLRVPHPHVERQLIQATRGFDLIVTMGSGAATFFRSRGSRGLVEVMPGGIDGQRYMPPARAPETDLLLVGRLAPIKRVDLFLRAVRHLADEMPDVRASIVGDGPLREALERRAADLQLARHVEFRGARAAMPGEFARAAIFVLTSETEGLSLALMEAMMSGLPAVVPDVGDLADLVEDGSNGFLLRDHTPEAFAAALARLLRDPELRQRFSHAARRTAERHEVCAASARWTDVLRRLHVGSGLAASVLLKSKT